MFSEVFVCLGGGGGKVSLVPSPFWGIRYLWSHVPSGKLGSQGVGYLWEVGYLRLRGRVSWGSISRVKGIQGVEYLGGGYPGK